MTLSATFTVTGRNIFMDNHHVATLKDGLWATLEDEVVTLLECADCTAVSEDEHAEAIKELENEHREEVKELEDKLEVVTKERDELEARCDAYEAADGVQDVLEDLRNELALEKRHREALEASLREARKALAALNAPKPRKRRAA
jgi:iron-sulfur cluster repair protein YtfE (RIC family)